MAGITPGRVSVGRGVCYCEGQYNLPGQAPGTHGAHWPELLDTDTLIVDIPPRSSKQGEEFHPQQIQNLVKLIKKSSVSEIIYVSSTSVYPELNREVREEDVLSAEQSAAPHLVEAEQTLTELREDGRRVAVVRCGGLMGYDRIPGNYVRGKKGITTGNVPVNYIHRDDAVAMIGALLHTGVPNETFNCVAPEHPSRRAVYEASCREFGWEVPTFAEPEQQESYKVVSSEKLTTYLNYTYIYKDPLAFYYRLQ
jgi:nucleoside-diphosphate-sugar epimerase